MLQLFAKTECLLPNMFVGTLTGKSVTEALNKSITSAMIIKYLEDHRHPKIAHRHPVLPLAVKEQVSQSLLQPEKVVQGANPREDKQLEI